MFCLTEKWNKTDVSTEPGLVANRRQQWIDCVKCKQWHVCNSAVHVSIARNGTRLHGRLCAGSCHATSELIVHLADVTTRAEYKAKTSDCSRTCSQSPHVCVGSYFAVAVSICSVGVSFRHLGLCIILGEINSISATNEDQTKCFPAESIHPVAWRHVASFVLITSALAGHFRP